MNTGTKVKLQKTLYATKDGIAIGPGMGKHYALELTGKSGVAQFPVQMGAVGTIIEVTATTITVDYGQAVIRFQKGLFGSFNLPQI